MKRALSILVLLVLSVALFAGGQKEAQKPGTTTATTKEIKNPDTFIYVSHGDAETLDPCKAYDNASGGVIQNIYETLVYYDGPSTDKFVPILAEQVPTVENGGITNGGKTYRFKIRKGVTFHSGNPLTPEDVRYSFLRALVTDPDAGPIWMFYSPFFGTSGSRDDDGNIVAKFEDFEKAVKVEGDYVVFNLRAPFPPFLATLCGSWSSIVDKKFCIEHGDWDGTAATWKKYNAPKDGAEILNHIASGTGPYKLDRWEKGVETVLVRNENYWGKKPAMAKAIYKIVDEWSTRKLMLLQGDADCVEVDPMYYDEMEKESGIKVIKNLKELAVQAINFNQKINATDNPYIGSGKLDGAGIPPDFFSDKNIRLAFAHAFDMKTYINDIIAGQGIECPTPHVTGLPYRDDSLKSIPFDLKKSEEYFKKAFGGQVWEKGFAFDFLFNQGNDTRESTAKLFAETIGKINPKFKITVRGIEWPAFVQAQRQRTMPIFYIGWIADYPHPDNFMYTYMHSEGGVYASRASYKNEEADRLLEAGQTEQDPKKAKDIYYRLQAIWLEDVPGIVLHQPVIRRYFKDWVQGYYFHPMENPLMYKMFSKGY